MEIAEQAFRYYFILRLLFLYNFHSFAIGQRAVCNIAIINTVEITFAVVQMKMCPR